MFSEEIADRPPDVLLNTLTVGTGPVKPGTGSNVYAPLDEMVSVPMISPVTGSVTLAVLPAGMIWLLPGTVKPLTVAVWPAGGFALSRTLPLTGWSIGVVALLGPSV